MSSVNELKLKIPGWGADLNSKDRPAASREKFPEAGTGAHWDSPEQQEAHIKILKSVEHQNLTSTFGTACPIKGLSGKIREYAYQLSEAQKSHWLILLLADRIDVIESILTSMISLRPHNPLKEMGLASEFRKGGVFSRFGQHRADMRRITKEAMVLASFGTILFLGQKKRKKAA